MLGSCLIDPLLHTGRQIARPYSGLPCIVEHISQVKAIRTKLHIGNGAIYSGRGGSNGFLRIEGFKVAVNRLIDLQVELLPIGNKGLDIDPDGIRNAVFLITIDSRKVENTRDIPSAILFGNVIPDRLPHEASL